MVQIQQKGSAFALVFSDTECERLGFEKATEYELTKAGNGVWILVKGTAQSKNAETEKAPLKKAEPIDELEQKIIGILRKSVPRDKIEGWFEKKLNEEENKKFTEMLAAGKIIKFKSNETYRKSLYTLPPKTSTAAVTEKSFDNKEKPIEEYTIEKDGFVVVKNELRAKALSAELGEKIKAGEIRGIRGFSGEFFVIQSPLLISSQEKALAALRAGKSAEVAALAEKTGMTPTLIRIAMEFLKEEGQVIEKKKGLYQYIE